MVVSHKTTLFADLKKAGLPLPKPEYRFHSKRQFRFDFFWPTRSLALEVEGGVYARKGAKRCAVCKEIPKGRHATTTGMLRDMEKYNLAAQLGILVVRVTPKMIVNNEVIELLKPFFGE